jgi:hypothetical protein
MKKEKKDQIIRRISEQSMLKLTPMPFRARDPIRSFIPKFHLGLIQYAPLALFKR